VNFFSRGLFVLRLFEKVLKGNYGSKIEKPGLSSFL